MKWRIQCQNLLVPESGYTVVEVLVALAVFSVGLLSVGQFAAKLILNSDTRDLITATSVARNEMEYVISNRAFSPDATEIRLNHKLWNVERKIQRRAGLITIHIVVRKKASSKPVAQLKTVRLDEP